MSDDEPTPNTDPTREVPAVSDDIGEFERWRADNDPTYAGAAPAEAAAAEESRRAPGWWRAPAAIAAVLVLVAVILGLAAINDGGDGDEVASTATTSSSTSSSTSSTSSTSTTLAPPSTTPPVIVTAPTIATATTAATRPGTATTTGAPNHPMTIEASWIPETPRVGEPVVFNVRVSDPDASPIREGACGTGNGVSFGDGGRHPTSCGAPCPSGLAGSASRGSASFRYSHAYGAPGFYTITMTFASGDRCSTRGASVQTLTFNINVTD